ncbi:homoserine dehydrogenase [Campylobacter fetus]|uniref:Homoserine dehydrogenase n=1 Tax=Campylobacter fetus TaxID=196 RepID=A0A5L8V7I7_CAMFE|nr:homoserine dehydrogenase [Campylobacter fetus]EAI4414668.1 homoserine dehydrogenase [Campylobacter fetus]EAK0415418.1 homoserine dehydrogenase [Campylobacter fetus]EAK0452835.1 homoserine dehydrogenase [Campylobacter fetus]EAL3880225.1 homoserine dehydrogenase [Campylobacter fetus]EAL3991959.1 homoserine dehydrogenase [Campylobacter fetus]
MRVAILGLGTVGSEVANVLINNRRLITARSGVEITPVIGVVRDISKKRESSIPLSDDIQSVINRDDIDVFVELMGGVEKPYDVVSKILKKKKPVVTANKALLAYHRSELEMLAGDTPFGYEASVAGGIPIIKALREGLSANHIEKIVGIMNGTSNYILTNMMQNGTKFNEALKRAQELGYAEADPTFDIGGFDTAHKLLILASIAYLVHAKPQDILIEGIGDITNEDIYFANEFEYVIKLLAIAKRREDKVELRVHPALIRKDKMIAKVDGVMNAISVTGDAVGESLFYGAGAGGSATASAVISDLIDIARNVKNPMLGYKAPLEIAPLELMSPKDIRTKYYLRLKVADEIGVLAKITDLMSKNNLSIDSFLQKPRVDKSCDSSTLYFTTHTCLEADMVRVVNLLENESFIKDKPFMIRIEE